MKNMIIDGISCEFENERNVLEVARKYHIDIPNLCYCESLSIYGGCRLCVVENERGGVEAACSMLPKDGMVIKTNTARLRKHRQMILELLLASHRSECTTCEKSEKCKLQSYAKRYNVTKIRFPIEYSKLPIDNSSLSIVRDPSKCILCGKCVRMCSEVQNIHAIDFAERGMESYISCGFENKLADTKCVGCGQCAAVCPTGALLIKNEVSKLWEAIYDPVRKVAVQVAPSVRVGIGEEFGLPASQPVMGKIVTALKMLGADYVFDTSLTADLTIMEESAEFMEKLKTGAKLPMFTSCCPGWIKHVENMHPHLMPQVSTCGSPMEMFGAILRQHYTDDELYSVAIMPCTAKKFEIGREDQSAAGVPDVDIAITTRELSRMIMRAGINFTNLPDEEFDSPLGEDTGAAVIFGATGGVMEAALRTANDWLTGKDNTDIDFTAVRGTQGLKQATVNINGSDIKVAVASGAAAAKCVMDRMKNGNPDGWAFVEIMGCPGGCVNGGGQPIQPQYVRDTVDLKAVRAKALYDQDASMALRKSHESPVVKALYSEWYDGFGGHKAHHDLHTSYVPRKKYSK